MMIFRLPLHDAFSMRHAAWHIGTISMALADHDIDNNAIDFDRQCAIRIQDAFLHTDQMRVLLSVPYR